MRTIKAVLVISMILFLQSASSAMMGDWNLYEGANFKVFYRNADLDFIKKTHQAAISHSRSIAKKLGVDIRDYWKADNKVKIYIYDDKEQYLSNTGAPVWSDGSSIQRTRTIYSFAQAKGFFDGALAHELGHIILKEMTGFQNEAVPVWLEEGIASLQEKKDSKKNRAFLKESLKKGQLLGIEDLSELDIRKVTDKRTLDLFYDQSLSIVKYLIEGFGVQRFSDFCYVLKATKDLNRALEKAYSLSDTLELERSWKAYLLG